MLARVLKPFLYSRDGISIEDLAVGVEREIAAAVAPGLAAAGFIADAAPSSELSVRHIGRGKYDVFRADERVTHGATTKEEAERALAEMAGA